MDNNRIQALEINRISIDRENDLNDHADNAYGWWF